MQRRKDQVAPRLRRRLGRVPAAAAQEAAAARRRRGGEGGAFGAAQGPLKCPGVGSVRPPPGGRGGLLCVGASVACPAPFTVTPRDGDLWGTMELTRTTSPDKTRRLATDA